MTKAERVQGKSFMASQHRVQQENYRHYRQVGRLGIGGLLMYALLIIWDLLSLFPIYWMIITSLKLGTIPCGCFSDCGTPRRAWQTMLTS